MSTPVMGTAVIVLDPGYAVLVVAINGHRNPYPVYWDEATNPQPRADRIIELREFAHRVTEWTPTGHGWTAQLEANR